MEENLNPQARTPREGSAEGAPQQAPRRRPRISDRAAYGSAEIEEPAHRRSFRSQQGGYQRSEGGYQRSEGSYQRSEGGYQSRPRRDYQEDGYQQPRRSYQRPEHGYQRPERPQNNYQRRERPQYDNQEGEYQPRQERRGGYQQREGGYQSRDRRQMGGRPQRGGFNKKQQRRGFVPRPVEYTESIVDPNEVFRLNKFLANAGVCSRREADELIVSGAVKVNGEVVSELGFKVTRKDSIMFNDQPVILERKVYVLLNKPKDTVTTSDDPQGRKTVMDLVHGASRERIYPVGRLDRNTTGVLLLTNDGDLASKLTHPGFMKKKIYHVWLDKEVSEEDLAKIATGIDLEDGPIHADAIAYATEEDRDQVGIEIHSGKNRIVRRIFETLGYRVVKLDRVYFAGLTKKNLPRGRWRHLTQQEVNMLKMGAFV